MHGLASPLHSCGVGLVDFSGFGRSAMKQSWDVQTGKKWSHSPSVGWNFVECTMGAPQPGISFEWSGGQREAVGMNIV